MEARNPVAANRPFVLSEADRAEYDAAVNCLRAAAGLPVNPGRPIRELLREESFEADLACAFGSRILEAWPLNQQLEFLNSIASMHDLAKDVHIHAQVYELYRRTVARRTESIR